MKSPTFLVSAISIESRWKIIGEAPNYACAGESAIGGWGVGTIRKDKDCIDHRRVGKVCTVQTLHLCPLIIAASASAVPIPTTDK